MSRAANLCEESGSADGASAERPSGVVAVAPPVALRAPVEVRFGGKVVELPCGELIVGRARDCDLQVNEPLASRVHALLTVEAEQVTIEDLRSHNGVQVNGRLILRSTVLRHHDCVSLGGTSLVFAQARARRGYLARRALNDQSGERVASGAVGASAAELLELIARLCDELASAGQSQTANRVLSRYLHRLREHAAAGSYLTDAGSARACSLAMSLARAEPDSGWLDYVLELHLLAGRRLSSELMAEYAATCLLSGSRGCNMLAYYVEWVRAVRASPAELAALEQLVAVARSTRR